MRYALSPVRKTRGRPLPARSFGDLLSHLATLSRNDMHVAGTPHDQTFQLLAVPTPTQHRAFDLIHTPIPLQLR